MTDIIKRLKEPEAHYPGNFDTPKRANAMLSCLCQEAAEEIESLRRELTEARQKIADRKADCETCHDQDEATIAELRRQLKHMTNQYNAALEAEQVRYRQVVEKDAEIGRLKLAANIGKSKDVRALAEILLSDCGCSTEYRALLDKVENRLWTFFDEQLAASQSREQQANECRIALVHQIHELADHIERAEYCINDIDMLKQMRGQRAYAMKVAGQWNQNGNPFSTDTTALESMIAKAGEVMRERCAYEAVRIDSTSCARACNEIRALPAVTLDDLKGGA